VSSRVIEMITKVEACGGRLWLDEDHIKYSAPKSVLPEIRPFLHELRAHRDELAAVLRERPSAEGVSAPPNCPPLPQNVRLIRYAPKKPPVAVQPRSIVTDVDKFICAYLRDLRFRLEHPEAYACAPLPEILAKLAEVGLELALETPDVPTKGS
jgi:hypothetical protein